MRLKSFSIQNFRAINGAGNQLVFDENNIIFIFGKNNIGKSSVLHAYRFFASPTQSAAITDFYGQNISNSIVIEAVYVKEESDSENFESKGLDKWVCERTGEVKFKKTWSKTGSIAEKETFDPVSGEYKSGGFGGLDQILTNAIPNIIYLEAMPSAKLLTDWLEKEIKSKLLKKIKDSHADEYSRALTAIKSLQNKVESDGYLGEIKAGANKYFSKTFPGLELNICSTPYKEADLVKAFEKDFSVTISNKSEPAITTEMGALAEAVEAIEALADDQLIEADGQVDEAPVGDGEPLARTFDLHGHGLIRQAIINILGIFKDSSDDQKHIILFEEPELYLHPSNKRKFRDTLYEIAEQENYQMICVSHDPQLIDLSRPHTSLARFVLLENGETAIYQAGDNIFSQDEDTKNRIQMLNRFNPHVCETFFSDEVVLVEGDTEAIVVRELIHKCSPGREVFVLNTGSKNNIPFFIRVLRHFNIKLHVIHDSDERYLYKEGERLVKSDSTPRLNSAWALNGSIWDELVQCNDLGVPAYRYVSVRNFEHAHGYRHDSSKGKPLSAHEFAKEINMDDESKCIVRFVKQILGLLEREGFPPEMLDAIVEEPY
ncbi:TPA: AAA family ATPase [Pseudomonas aeruginosa]|nr:AAA family ATPase [Pseudomonas aeruginosa]